MLENAKWFNEINELKEEYKSHAKDSIKWFETFEYTKILSDDGKTVIFDEAPAQYRAKAEDIEKPCDRESLNTIESIINLLPFHIASSALDSDTGYIINYRALPKLNAEAFYFHSDKNAVHPTRTREFIVPFGTLLNLSLESISKRSIRRMSKESSLDLDYVKEDLASLKGLLDFCTETKTLISESLIKNVFRNTNLYKNPGIGSSIFDSMKYLEEHYKKNIVYFASNTCDLGFIFYHTFMAAPLLEKNATLNKCKLCGRYFFPDKRSDQKYCYWSNPEYPSLTCISAAERIRARDYKKKLTCEKKYHQIANRLSQRTKDYNFDDFKEEYNLYKESVNRDLHKYQKTLDWLNKIEKSDKYTSKLRSNHV